jgi:GDPmannose 4,6-dehydratase
LGNLDAKRDWGHARDFVEAQWLILQHPEPVDYVIATGVQHSIRQFVEKAAQQLGFSLKWSGTGLEEKAYDEATGKPIVEIDPRFFRAAEVESLIGDASKARRELGWQPKISFDELVREMVDEDLALASREKLLIEYDASQSKASGKRYSYS